MLQIPWNLHRNYIINFYVMFENEDICRSCKAVALLQKSTIFTQIFRVKIIFQKWRQRKKFSKCINWIFIYIPNVCLVFDNCLGKRNNGPYKMRWKDKIWNICKICFPKVNKKPPADPQPPPAFHITWLQKTPHQWKSSTRPSQVTCTATTVHVTCT